MLGALLALLDGPYFSFLKGPVRGPPGPGQKMELAGLIYPEGVHGRPWASPWGPWGKWFPGSPHVGSQVDPVPGGPYAGSQVDSM